MILTGGRPSLNCKNSTTEYSVTLTGINNLSYAVDTEVFMCGVASDDMKLYINGYEAGSSTDTCPNFVSNNNFRIGTYYDGSTARSFNGTINEVIIYNRSLSRSEIERLYYINEPVKGQRVNSMDNFYKLGENYSIITTNSSSFDVYIREIGNVLFNETGKGGYKWIYTAYNTTYSQNNTCIMWANSSDGITWKKQGLLMPCGGSVLNTTNALEDPYVVYNGSTYFLYAEDKFPPTFQNISLYTSKDFLTWTRYGVVLKPQYFAQSDISSPTVLYENGIFYLWFEGRNTSNNGEIGLAYSTNGSSFTAYNNIFVNRSFYSFDSDSVVPDGIIKDGSNYYLTYHISSGGEGIVKFSNITDKTTYVKNKYPISDIMGRSHDTMLFYDTRFRYIVDYYGTDVQNIQITTNDILRIDVVKTDDTLESTIQFDNLLV
jgi:hypothetical protein